MEVEEIGLGIGMSIAAGDCSLNLLSIAIIANLLLFLLGNCHGFDTLLFIMHMVYVHTVCLI